MRLAVIGRPNVGKSSLVNRLPGRERMIVADVAGTTRDAIDSPITIDGRRCCWSTRPASARAAVSDSVEFYATLRSGAGGRPRGRRARRLDATEGLTSEDLRIADLAMKAGCATALVLNKWDLTSGDDFDLDHERARVNRKLRLRPKVLTPSALTGRYVNRILALAVAPPSARAIASRRRRSTASWATLVASREPPQKQGRRLKLMYIDADRDPPAALLDPHQPPHATDARLRVLRGESPA